MSFNAFRVWLGSYYYPHPYITTIACAAVFVGICYLTFHLLLWKQWISVKEEGIFIHKTNIEDDTDEVNASKRT